MRQLHVDLVARLHVAEESKVRVAMSGEDGDAALALSGPASTVALVVIALAFAGLAVLRSRRVS